ncbi:hypothetical protein D3C84_218970 [compost metagenome]
MRLHYALGKARGTAGIEDAGKVVIATPGVIDGRRVLQQLFVAQHAGRCAALARIDELRRVPGLGTDAFDQRQELVIDDEQARIAVIQRIDDLRDAPTGIDRVEHTTAPPHAHHVFQITVAVERKHADAVTGGHAQVAQGAGQAGDTLAELPVGVAPLTEDADDLLRGLLQRALQALGQVHGTSATALISSPHGQGLPSRVRAGRA